jgi:hypothetical protein
MNRIVLLLACACAQVNPPAPVVRIVSHAGLAAAPLTVCRMPDGGSGMLAFSDVEIEGDGLGPDVRDATADQPQFVWPTVVLRGPQTFDITPRHIGVEDTFDGDSHVLHVALPASPPPPEGSYAVEVSVPGADVATLDSAILLQPPPSVSSFAPQSTCATAPVDVVVRGGPFSPGIGARLLPETTPLPTRRDAVDQITVTIPAGTHAGSSMPFQVSILDPDGCTAIIQLSQVCP